MTQHLGLHQLAERAGIAVFWNDAHGMQQEVGAETLIQVLAALGLKADSDQAVAASLEVLNAEARERQLPPLVTAEAAQPIRFLVAQSHATVPYRLQLETGQINEGTLVSNETGELVLPGIRALGYHRLTLGAEDTTLAIAPARCYGVGDALSGAAHRSGTAGRPQPFGVNLQVYSLRGGHPSGLGDFATLREFCLAAARLGVDAVGINPVHAGFGADPSRFSPYAPSSRLFLNPLYVDPASTFGPLAVKAVTESLDVDGLLRELDQAPLVDWPRAAGARMKTLRALFERRASLMNSQQHAELARFIAQGGEALRDHARYEALHHLAYSGTAGWQAWPEALRDPRSAAVEQFAKEHAEEVEFHGFLQWLASRDMQAVQQHARSAGMSIGLVADLAVGTDPNGSQAWSRQGEIITGLSCGAPPDLYNPWGQSWGLTVFSPRALRLTGFRAFLEMLRASLAHAGALRIDHVLGFARLWLVPEGSSPRHGAYVAYPMVDLMRLVALESWRHHAVIIGENLGTVPAGFNHSLQQAGMLGTTVLWFERSWERIAVDDGHGGQHHVDGFRAARDWSSVDMAVTTTHDLPTVAGWWLGHDIEWKARLQLLAAGHRLEDDLALRALDRVALWRALEQAQLVQGALPAADAAPLDAILQFVAQAPAALVMFPIEDLLGTIEQPNLPGTFDQHPNWRRRLTRPVAEILAAALVKQRFSLIQDQRRGGG